MSEPERGDNERVPRPPTLWQTWLSVVAAFLGVQTRANRERDAASGKAGHFIVLGLLATILLVSILIAVVTLITRLAAV